METFKGEKKESGNNTKERAGGLLTLKDTVGVVNSTLSSSFPRSHHLFLLYALP